MNYDDLKFLNHDSLMVHSKRILQILSIEIIEGITMNFQIECAQVKSMSPCFEGTTHEAA
jgi:hypothetical protein